MTFKQKYIHEKGPFPFDFQQERKQMFQKIINLLQQFDRNMWTVSSFNFGSMLESFKQVYGLTTEELQTLLTLLSNIFYEQPQSSVEPRLIILKLLNRLLQEQIEITENFTISNKKLMKILVDRVKNGSKDPLKHQDAYMEELSKFILQISKNGEESTNEAMEKSIEYKNSRVLALFIGSLKTQQRADEIVNELLKDCSLWQRDVSWFYIISQIAKKYHKLDFSSHYITIFQEIIKNFTTLLDPMSNEELKKLTDTEPCIGIRPILKSMACLLVNLLLPNSNPQSNYVWNAVERIFNVITTTLDHINEPAFIYEELNFMRSFVKYFLLRYRKERKIFLKKNEDFVQDFHGEPEKQLFVDEWLHKSFNNLWPQIIPKILFYEQSDSMSSKIIVDLAMFDHEFFMPIIINSVRNVLTRDDLSMISLYSTKMSILFLFDFIFKDQQQYISDLIQIFKLLLQVVQKLGVSQNLDILELVFRGFFYMEQQTLNDPHVQTIIDDCLEIILKNLNSMSISLEQNQNQQSQLYIDLANIYFPFLVRLDKNVLNKFMDKLTFKILNEIPEHAQAYELLSIVCGYIEPKFAQNIFKQIYCRLITIQEPASGSKTKKSNGKNQKNEKSNISYYFFQNIKQVLSTKNQNHIKWYTEMIQCLYQYHPQNIIRDFSQVEKIIICLLKEWDNSTFLEIALDVIFNLILCLCHVHFDWTEFNKPQNHDYKTMNVKWQTGSNQSIQLLLYIYDKYFLQLISFMKNRYGDKVSQMEDESIISYIINDKQYSVHSKDLKLIDSLLIPLTNQKSEHLEQKKLIYKVFSIQYTILSAFMVRSPFYAQAQKQNAYFFQQNAFKTIRKTARQYCDWICSLMQHYNILWEPTNLKLFNYFWRQTLDEVFFTLPLQSTVQKLSPYYYSQIYRRKQLLRCSFLVLNEAYTLFTSRIQFLMQVNPVAYMNHPQYLRKHLIFGLNHQFESALHSYIPASGNVHQVHKNMMLLCRFHIDPTNKSSYSYLYMNSTEKRDKQKYLVSLKMILANIKKIQNLINFQCCIKDQFILDSILSAIQLFKVFENKIDKLLVIDLFYLMMVFGFDCNLIGESRNTDIRRFFEYAPQLNGNAQNQDQQFLSSMKKMINIQLNQPILDHIEQEKCLQQIDLKLKKTSSFRSPGRISSEISNKIEDFINHLLTKLNVQKSSLDKDAIVHCLMMVMFSKFLLLNNPIFGRITATLIELTKSQIVELFDVSKTGLFHIINRFNSLKKISNQVENKIVKRPFEDFLVLRYLGGQTEGSKDVEYYRKVHFDKSDNYFYPIKKLFFYEYEALGADPDSDAFQNQCVLLKFLTSHKQLKDFIVSCSHDKDLKQQETEIDVSMFDENNMGIASNGHKLLNYILDSNPKKNDIFAPFIQNFSIYPVSFYPRMLRKLIRMGNQDTIKNLIEIAEQLRLSNEIQEKKMSLYISCQIMYVTPVQNPFTVKFIDYLAICSNDVFQFSTQCLFLMFTKNFVVNRKIYDAFIKRFREEKGSSRLRHLTLMNLFLMAQGRFSRGIAIQGIQHLLNGIDEGSNEVSEVIISMIVSCFVIAINLKQIGPWINQSVNDLILQKKIYKLNDYVGYQIDQSLKNILAQIVAKTKVEENMESKNLKIYSKVASKILSSISVYRYNDSFYEVLKDLIFYVVQKTPQQGQTDEEIILQLKDSEYPENIYLDLVGNLKNMVDNPLSVIKKKLKYVESLVINYCYSMNKMEVPEEILIINEKSMSMDFVISVSNMYRLMTRNETIQRVEAQMSKKTDKNFYNLMALLLSAGVREYEWKEDVLKQILKSKKLKIVKEFISYWWKGKNPQTQSQKALQYLVQGVQNPYSYFA